MKNYNVVLFMLVSGIVLITSNTIMPGKDKVRVSGNLNVQDNIRSITQGVETTLKDPATLTSVAAVILWENIKNKKSSGLFDVSSRHIACSIAGGVLGKVIKDTIGQESINKYFWGPTKVIFSNPFLATYVGYSFIFKYNDIKNNPFSYAAEIGLLGLHALDVPNNGWSY